MPNNGMSGGVGIEARGEEKDVKSQKREASNYAFIFFLPSLFLSDVNSLRSTLLSIVSSANYYQ